jgi:hypothetical protein
MMQITLTPNRSNPRRYVRFVTYRRYFNAGRGVDVVDPYQVSEVDGKLTVTKIHWRDVSACEIDEEFATEWGEHVRYQAQLGRDDVRA